MKTVYKYPLPVTDRPVVAMPAGSRVLHVAAPNSTPAHLLLWAEVDTEAPTVERTFVIVGTGHPLPAVGAHIGTVQAGKFVWHVYGEATDA